MLRPKGGALGSPGRAVGTANGLAFGKIKGHRLPARLMVAGLLSYQLCFLLIYIGGAMNPVIGGLSHMSGLDLPTVARALALSTNIGGNTTHIGTSTNLVEASRLFYSGMNLFFE